jgi:phosphatidylethanolamine/phosphatidyl-N-methylethanolamine N-methyltransferase
MSSRRPKPGLPAEEDLAATVLFLRQWLRDPRSIAAIAPSGRELARRIASAVGRNARRVIEIGAGTGVVTQALLSAGVPESGMLVVERNPELHRMLTRRFPGVEVLQGDALDLAQVVANSGRLTPGGVDAVVSGLGLVNLGRESQRSLLGQVFELLRVRGRFVQFTYAPVLPVSREVMSELDLTARRTAFSLLNLPPASVYVLTRRRAGRRT